MRGIYWVWAAGLVLKLVGAAWDVAWHFRLLREAISPPHLVNIAGGLLVAFALVHELRHPAPHRRGPLAVVLVGMGLFLGAIPFDQLWHTLFGIDITTWSPAHMMLFSGTAVGIVGVILLFLADLRHERGGRDEPVRRASVRERAMLALLVILLVEAIAFPLTYNEYTTMAVRDAWTDPGRLDPAIVEMAKTVPDPVFHGTPKWLYPVYSVVFAVLVGTLLRASLGPGWAAVALIGASGVRAVANAGLTSAGWPEAVVPLQYLPIAVAIELVWLIHAGERVRAAAGGAVAAIAAYAYFVTPIPGVTAVPLDLTSAPAGVLLATVAAVGALRVRDRTAALLARVPVVQWERLPGQVRDWAREKWSG